MSEPQLENVRAEYTVRNYDAVNRAIDGQAQIIEGKAQWIQELVKGQVTKRMLYIAFGVCATLLTLAALAWLFWQPAPQTPSSSAASGLTKEDRRQIADEKSLTRGQKFHTFTEVALAGEDIITGHLYIYPETDVPEDQWCYLAYGGDELGRFARGSGMYERTDDPGLLPFLEGCKFIE